jgi:HPt (histidine-containing phosphotransfer) domain-containing protein
MKETYNFIEDLSGVMERLGGNEALLARLLVKFRDTYGDSRPRLKFLLDATEKEEAYRLVHSIKGVSANLGIGELYRCAISLESRMKADEYTVMKKETEVFLAELERIMAELA